MIYAMRRFAAISLALAGSVAGGATIALAASGSAGAPIANARAVALTRAVNLRTSDLPAPTKVVLYFEGEDISLSKADRCARPGVVTHRPVTAEASMLLTPFGLVVSAVLVMPSPRIAASELATFASRRGHECFARGAPVVVSPAGPVSIRVGPAGEAVQRNEPPEPPEPPNPIKATFIPLAKSLGPDAIGVHALTKVPGASKSPIYHTDAALFRVGPALIFLLTDDERPFPPATERRLLALLHRRAAAYKL